MTKTSHQLETETSRKFAKKLKKFTDSEVREFSVAALQNAIQIVGSSSELARMIGISRQLLWRFQNISKMGVSPQCVIPIEKSTAGVVHRSQLRADLYPKFGRREI